MGSGPHTCVYPYSSRDHPRADTTLIAHGVQLLARPDQPSITALALRSEGERIRDYCSSYCSFSRKTNGEKKTPLIVGGRDVDGVFKVLDRRL
ncbi:unnamed protein product [Dovyalis caffra]|uniref:Uncharacterized protein n=1 Tax=Dovyalis caffra TaxID=77055 RepID=A0AAV1RKS0_9ROSI|nr:unnamed protein product [Dovyalis caffra]